MNNLLHEKQNVIGLLIFIFLFFLVAAVATSTYIQTSNPTKTQTSTKNLTPQAGSSYAQTILYGNWTSQGTVIKAYQIATNTTYVIAQLSLNVKKVHLLSPSTFLFINNTNAQDYGTEIDMYDVTTKKITTMLKADAGFGIDDYFISPNNRYLVESELQFAPNSSIVYGSTSKMYSYDLSSQSSGKHLIYNEIADKPTHYPRGVTDDGKLFFDTWIPNSDRGWAYGMSVSDFMGNSKQDIASMSNGTYGSQPVLSPDGKHFAFVGYDGSQGLGTEFVNGVRRAIISRDTVELLDTTTLSRSKLMSVPTQPYDFVAYDKTTGNLIVNKLTDTISNTDVSFYDFGTNTAQKIPTNKNQFVMSSLASNAFLLGTIDNSLQSFGNLGEQYQFSYTTFSILNLPDVSPTLIPISDSFMQLITIVPNSYIQQTLLSNGGTLNNKQLQLQTFTIKPTLAPVRIVQQNQPVTPNREDRPRKSVTITSSGGSIGDNMGSMDCKPALYLYPPYKEPIHVELSVNGELTYTNPIYPAGGWEVIADSNGKIIDNSSIFDYLYYEAKIPDQFFADITAQNTGYTVAYTNLNSFFKDTLPKLGLNTSETNEFSVYWLKALPYSQYYRVSILPQKLIDTFAPLTITPKPDTILRVTLYFQPLDHYIQLVPPQIVTVQRNGFTVVEWAGAVKTDKTHPFTCLM